MEEEKLGWWWILRGRGSRKDGLKGGECNRPN